MAAAVQGLAASAAALYVDGKSVSACHAAETSGFARSVGKPVSVRLRRSSHRHLPGAVSNSISDGRPVQLPRRLPEDRTRDSSGAPRSARIDVTAVVPSPARPDQWLRGPVNSQPHSPFTEVTNARPWDWRVDTPNDDTTGLVSKVVADDHSHSRYSHHDDPAGIDVGSPVGLQPFEGDAAVTAAAGVDGALQILSAVDEAMAQRVRSLPLGAESAAAPFSELNPKARSEGEQCGPLQHPQAAPALSSRAMVGSPSTFNPSSLGPQRAPGGRTSGPVVVRAESAGDADVDIPEVDIAERLPELREMLGILEAKARGRREREGTGTADGPGNVFLVGTGPGDPDLLTLKSVRVLQRADLILYDRLVSTDILRLAGPDARLLYVGKASGYHTRTQQEILQLLLSFAHAGATVVRLKGGDPLVFGRGGEEMEFLQSQGIQVKIVPGITAASGIAAELGVPLTHRGVANSVRFLTGHSRKGGLDPLPLPSSPIDLDCTLVVYMGLATLPALAERLAANGMPKDTPAVAVERGTTEAQRTVFASLEDLPSAVAAAQLVSPTLIVIGQVVALSPAWPFGQVVASELYRDSLYVMDEPRDRRLRGADPPLPSERRGQAGM